MRPMPTPASAAATPIATVSVIVRVSGLRPTFDRPIPRQISSSMVIAVDTQRAGGTGIKAKGTIGIAADTKSAISIHSACARGLCVGPLAWGAVMAGRNAEQQAWR